MKTLDHYGIRRGGGAFTTEFLTDRTLHVLAEGATSDSISVIRGVPEGTVLGPLLFLLFVNDLPDCVLSSTRPFADDRILYRQIKSKQDCDILQDDLNKLAAWDKKWGMAFHPDKCSAIRISRSRNPISMDYSLKGHILDKEDHTKYLGVELQSSLSLNRHIDQTVKKANSMLGFPRRNLRGNSEQTKVTAYC